MVSKASEDFPEPLRPVITVKVLRGISTEMFFRLCWRAPLTVILLMAMDLINLGKRAGTAASLGKASPHSQGRKGQRAALLRILMVLNQMVNFATGKSRRALGSTTCPYDRRTGPGPEGPTPLVIMKFEPKLLKMHCS